MVENDILGQILATKLNMQDFCERFRPSSWRVMRNTTQSFFGEPKFVKLFGLHGGVIDFVWYHGFMNCCYTCSSRLTFGLCLFILWQGHSYDKVTRSQLWWMVLNGLLFIKLYHGFFTILYLYSCFWPITPV